MIKRTCPKCGRAWYSEDSSQAWKCESCGTDLGPDLNCHADENTLAEDLTREKDHGI